MDSRRGFFGKVTMFISLALSYGTAAAFAGLFLYPRKRASIFRSIYVAPLAHIPDGGTRLVKDLQGTPVQVVREGDKLRALSTVCSHLGCRVRWEETKKEFFCPCHNAVFDREGKVVSGPPPRPLDRYEVEVAAGHVYLKVKDRA